MAGARTRETKAGRPAPVFSRNDYEFPADQRTPEEQVALAKDALSEPRADGETTVELPLTPEEERVRLEGAIARARAGAGEGMGARLASGPADAQGRGGDPPEVYGAAAESVASESPSVGGGAPVRGGGAPQRAVAGLTERDGSSWAGSDTSSASPSGRSGQSLKELEAELARLKAMTGSRGGRVAKGGSASGSEPTPSKSAGASKGAKGPNYLKDEAPVSPGAIDRARSGR